MADYIFKATQSKFMVIIRSKCIGNSYIPYGEL